MSECWSIFWLSMDSNCVIETQNAGNFSRKMTNLYWTDVRLVNWVPSYMVCSLFICTSHICGIALCRCRICVCVFLCVLNWYRNKTNTPPPPPPPHRNGFFYISMTSRKTKIYLRFYAFIHFIKTYKMLLKMYCWPILWFSRSRWRVGKKEKSVRYCTYRINGNRLNGINVCSLRILYFFSLSAKE